MKSSLRIMGVALLSIVLAVFLSACGGGSSSDGTVAFTYTCSANESYTAFDVPVEFLTGTNPNTVAVVLYGKNGSPLADLYLPLYNDLLNQGIDVIAPYMPWGVSGWDGTLCQGISYLESIIADLKANGKTVILMGHSMGAAVASIYVALSNTTDVDALVLMAPGHLIHVSQVLQDAHASSVEKAKNMVSNDQGDNVDDFITYSLGGETTITTTANIYLSYHDLEQYPHVHEVLPNVTADTLFIAGQDDPLTTNLNYQDLFNRLTTVNKQYTVVNGNHGTMLENVAVVFDEWYTIDTP